MDIIVTTPKSRMKEAAAEAEACIKAGGGRYFRRFSFDHRPNVEPGDRVFYVEDGFVRGFAVVDAIRKITRMIRCNTTGRVYAAGFYVFMSADSWRWIKPIPMRGFQGYRYKPPRLRHHVIGGWRDPKPEVESSLFGKESMK